MRRWRSALQAEVFVEIQRHVGVVCSVHKEMGQSKAGKEGWEQILRFLTHPKDCGLFPTGHLYSWLVFICISSS